MTRPKMSRQAAKLTRMIAQLERDPKADQSLLAAARKALADYEALPEHVKAWADGLHGVAALDGYGES